MKLNNVEDVKDFQLVLEKSIGNVFLKSSEGDIFNLKSTLSQYIAIGELLKKEGKDLELFCEEKCDEELFLNFFKNHSKTR